MNTPIKIVLLLATFFAFGKSFGRNEPHGDTQAVDCVWSACGSDCARTKTTTESYGGTCAEASACNPGDNSCPLSGCDASEYMCADKSCIPSIWKCDGEPDCDSDEDSCGVTQVTLSMAAYDVVSGEVISQVTYSVYADYNENDFMGCSGTECGQIVATASGASVPGDESYLIVASASGYYEAYREVVIYDDDIDINDIEMSSTLNLGQARVILRWMNTNDLDLHVYDAHDISNHVYWENRQAWFATLDADTATGPGVEAMQLTDLTGTFEVWVEIYGGSFTEQLVADSPASVEIYCHTCVGDDGDEATHGFVRSVTQSANDVANAAWEGKSWWKAGEFGAPKYGEPLYGESEVRWTTCTSGCYAETCDGHPCPVTGD